MRILLTGKNSFTGRVLLPMLKDAGHELFCLTRKAGNAGSDIVWDFSGPLHLDIPVVDAVIHLAAYVNFGRDIDVRCYRANTIATMHLAAMAREHHAYFIIASTIGIHGSDNEWVDQNTPINPVTHYAMSKYLAEESVRAAHIPHSVLRINGIYGLDGPPHMMLNQNITKAFHHKERPVLMGQGRFKRNYICVNDVARWLLHLIGRYEKKIGDRDDPLQEVLYLASPEIMTIESYLSQIVEILLPGEDMDRMTGAEGKDMIVKFTPFPFEHITFRQYLLSLL